MIKYSLYNDRINNITVRMKSGYIPQKQLNRLKDLVCPGKAIVIYGPRRVGKTTLLKHFAETVNEEYLLLSGEDIHSRHYLESQSIEELKALVGSLKLLLLDEAQYVREIGLNLKLMLDHIDGLKIVATGSSLFDLAHQTGEPLTGRKYTLLMLPLAQMEICERETAAETAAMLETRMIYGGYPEVVLMASNEQRALYLRELVSSYLFKDILQMEDIRHADKLIRILQLLAFQVGHEVSLAELGSQLSMSKNTVERYIDLLEKVFVIQARSGFSRNLRKEISKTKRYYFMDNGIRNALINNFNPLHLRDDAGPLWENYAIMERFKFNLYSGRAPQNYFWRTHDRKEIDLVEEDGGQLTALEMKWSPTPVRPPKDWAANYPKASYAVVHRENYLSYIR